MENERSKEYSDAMIEAFIGKPEKTLWYQMAFEKFTLNGVDKLTWYWSWWACFGGFLFLLYRKAYIPALILFIVSMTLGMIPFVSILFMVLAGGYSTYFIYKVYRAKLVAIENAVEDEQKRIETMREVGGYHQWVIWVYAIIMSMMFLFVLSALFIPFLAALQGN